MQSLHYVIAETGHTYNDTVNIAGVEITVNNTIESIEHINRIVKVVSAPKGTILQPGDEIIIHHNILRSVNGWHAKVYSEYYIKDNLYMIPPTEIFAYKRNGEWSAIAPFCFISPVEREQSKNIIESETEVSHKGNVFNTGTVWLGNEYLEKQGVRSGDLIMFKPFSEYEFEVEGKVYYKMSIKDIIGKM